jgi:hypothetical protein
MLACQGEALKALAAIRADAAFEKAKTGYRMTPTIFCVVKGGCELKAGLSLQSFSISAMPLASARRNKTLQTTGIKRV